jgi:hypothetical protein
MIEKRPRETRVDCADALNREEVDPRDGLGRRPKQAEELDDLLLLAENLKETLVPVQPSPAFVKNLLQQLVAAHREELPRQRPSLRRWVVLGAAALGSVLSIVGLVVYLIKNRMNPKAQAVGSA